MAIALITGASRGIGAATARALAQAGFDLLLVARSGAELGQLAVELRALGRRVETASIDLASSEAIEAPLQELCSLLGAPPAVVINNAGAAYTGGLAAMPVERWQWLLQLNLTSVFQVCRVVVPLLRSGGGGRIINISSHAARTPFPTGGPTASARLPWPASAAASPKRSAATGSRSAP